MLKHLKSRDDWNEKSLGAKGFTLIELLVVIIILGILAAVAIFAIGNIQGNAKKSACQTEVGTVETAIAAKMTETTTWTVPSSGTIAAGSDSGQLPNLKKNPEYLKNWSDIESNGTVKSGFTCPTT